MLELGLLTGPLGTRSSSSNAVINTPAAPRVSLSSMALSFSQVQGLNNHLTAVVARVDLAEKFSNRLLTHTFKSSVTFYFDPRVRRDRGSVPPPRAPSPSSPKAAAVRVSAAQEQTSLSRLEIKVSLPSSSPSLCQQLATRAEAPSRPQDASRRRRRGSCKIDSSLFVSIHN